MEFILNVHQNPVISEEKSSFVTGFFKCSLKFHHIKLLELL